MEIFFLVILAAGLYMAWNIGANDAANSIGTSVGSGVLGMRGALVRICIFDFLGAVLFGSYVTKTIGKGIVSLDKVPSADLVVMGALSSLLAAGAWLTIATWRGLPVSTTHSIVGAVFGFGLIAAGWQGIKWDVMKKIVVSWFTSPIAGAAAAFIIYALLIRRFVLKRAKMLKKLRGYSDICR